MLRVLLVEDSANDAELLERALRRGGRPDVVIERVETPAAMAAALARSTFDVVIADYALPRFGACEALNLLHRGDFDLPFIVVSGTIGEEAAARVIKAGADEFVPKSALERIVPAVERVVRDVAARRERETLVALNARLGRLLDHSPDDVYVFERDGRTIRQTNRAAREHVGCTRRDLLGRRYDEICSCPSGDSLDRALAPLDDGRAHQVVLDAVHRREDGESYPVEVRVQLSAQETPPVYLAIAQDVTARRKLEAEREELLARERKAREDAEITARENARLAREARDAVHVRDQFLGMAAHELRTPLTALRLAVQALRREIGRTLPKSATPIVAVAERASERMHRLGEDLLDAKRLTEGGMSLAREQVDLADVVRDAIDELAVVSPDAASTIRVHAATVSGMWDPARLEQLVRNLLTNAVKYGRGRPVDVTVGEDGSTATLTIRDHGIGIPAPDRERIFRRFERAAPPTRFGGLGLGLDVARTIAELHGGTIAVESEEGEGSTFTVTLPRRPSVVISRPDGGARASWA